MRTVVLEQRWSFFPRLDRFVRGTSIALERIYRFLTQGQLLAGNEDAAKVAASQMALAKSLAGSRGRLAASIFCPATGDCFLDVRTSFLFVAGVAVAVGTNFARDVLGEPTSYYHWRNLRRLLDEAE